MDAVSGCSVAERAIGSASVAVSRALGESLLQVSGPNGRSLKINCSNPRIPSVSAFGAMRHRL